MTSPLSLRSASPHDAEALERLARLDSQTPLAGPVLLAEREGRLVAAHGLSESRTVADPFVSSADAVALLRMRARQLVPAPGRSVARRRAARLAFG